MAQVVIAAEPTLISVKQGTHTAVAADSVRPSLSADGRIVAFDSGARLTPDDRNKIKDIYVYDRGAKALRRVVTQDPQRKNGGVSVSGDGCFIAFHSYAPTGKKMEIPLRSDIGLYTRETGDVIWPVKHTIGRELEGESLFPRLNGTGGRMVFTSNSAQLGIKEGFTQVYLYDQGLGDVRLLSRGANGEAANRPCGFPRTSEDGMRVAFLSAATNLEPPLPIENGTFHLYWIDRSTGPLVRIDLFEKGFDPTTWMAGAFDMDASGDILVFEGRHRDLANPYKAVIDVDLFLYDRLKDCVTLMTTGLFANRSHHPSLSADGRYLAFVLGDGGGVVIHDRATDRWQRIAEGRCDNPVISKDGRVIAFDRRDKSKRNVYVVENSLYEAK